MRPRSAELLASARSWLARAEASLEQGFPAGPVADAYFAMLYAARAALSEEDRYAKTHHGTWTLFGDLFVSDGRFDRALYRRARCRSGRRCEDVRERLGLGQFPLVAVGLAPGRLLKEIGEVP